MSTTTAIPHDGTSLTIWLPPIISALSFAVATIAFLRTSRVNEFQICTKLSEQIDEKWENLNSINSRRRTAYKTALIEVLNHYERCATLINELRLLRGRSIVALEQQILECLHRNWAHEYVRDTFSEARTSDETYREISKLMDRSTRFSFSVSELDRYLLSQRRNA